MEERQGLRQFGLRIGSLPTGQKNNILDLGRIKVGHATIIAGDGDLVPGKGPVRTGVTVILPHDGDIWNERPSAAFFSLNGCGVVSGSDWINECGALEGPIALTNSHSVGDVGKALTGWMCKRYPQIGLSDDAYLPVVGECDDSTLNDINGFHVKEEHVLEAINTASSEVLEQGAVGAGTGMSCYGFKGGIGSSSRLVELKNETYKLAVLVNTNHGQTEQLLIDAYPLGEALAAQKEGRKNKEGSIVMVIATDAPMNQRQLERICKRACMGLARTGSIAANGSGDFALAFSTSRIVPRHADSNTINLEEMHVDVLGKFFQAAIEASEESILNSLFYAKTVVGRDGNKVEALPIKRCLEILQAAGRLKG